MLSESTVPLLDSINVVHGCMVPLDSCQSLHLFILWSALMHPWEEVAKGGGATLNRNWSRLWRTCGGVFGVVTSLGSH